MPIHQGSRRVEGTLFLFAATGVQHLVGMQIEDISKVGFRFKIKADPRFEPQAYIAYVEDWKCRPNADIGLEDIFEF